MDPSNLEISPSRKEVQVEYGEKDEMSLSP